MWHAAHRRAANVSGLSCPRPRCQIHESVQAARAGKGVCEQGVSMGVGLSSPPPGASCSRNHARSPTYRRTARRHPPDTHRSRVREGTELLAMERGCTRMCCLMRDGPRLSAVCSTLYIIMPSSQRPARLDTKPRCTLKASHPPVKVNGLFRTEYSLLLLVKYSLYVELLCARG